MEVLLIVGGCFLLAIIVAQLGKAHANNLISEGKMVDREWEFWENEQTITTSASFESVLEAIDKIDFSDCRATKTVTNDEDSRGILFKSSYEWTAGLVYLGEENGKHRYNLSFLNWKTIKYDVPKNQNSMNMLLTSLEKMFLELDPATTVETRHMQVKTKTSFL